MKLILTVGMLMTLCSYGYKGQPQEIEFLAHPGKLVLAEFDAIDLADFNLADGKYANEPDNPEKYSSILRIGDVTYALVELKNSSGNYQFDFKETVTQTVISINLVGDQAFFNSYGRVPAVIVKRHE